MRSARFVNNFIEEMGAPTGRVEYPKTEQLLRGRGGRVYRGRARSLLQVPLKRGHDSASDEMAHERLGRVINASTFALPRPCRPGGALPSGWRLRRLQSSGRSGRSLRCRRKGDRPRTGAATEVPRRYDRDARCQVPKSRSRRLIGPRFRARRAQVRARGRAGQQRRAGSIPRTSRRRTGRRYVAGTPRASSPLRIARTSVCVRSQNFVECASKRNRAAPRRRARSASRDPRGIGIASHRQVARRLCEAKEQRPEYERQSGRHELASLLVVSEIATVRLGPPPELHAERGQNKLADRGVEPRNRPVHPRVRHEPRKPAGSQVRGCEQPEQRPIVGTESVRVGLEVPRRPRIPPRASRRTAEGANRPRGSHIARSCRWRSVEEQTLPVGGLLGVELRGEGGAVEATGCTTATGRVACACQVARGGSSSA